jgi:hypothetical protein
MSDLMLTGVLRMPMDNPDPLTLRQFVDRARQAADRIEADAKGIDRLTAELAQAMKERSRAITVGSDMEQEVERLREQLALAESVRAAQVAGLTEGMAKLKQDAARYVYLRDVAWHTGSLIFYEERYGPEDWNAHIDAARAALKGER